MKKKFLVIDAFGILYRYHFIFLKKPLINQKGQNVSSINGFLRTYFSIIKSYPCDYIAIALDSSRVTFRSEIYKEYKEQRESMPDDLRSQIPLLYELIDALGIKRIAVDNYEADDIIGLIAKENKNKNIKTIIYSPDKDILQLVDEDTTVIASNKENELVEYDRELVKEKRGVYPNQIIDLLALMGDSSDNIPGVRGVGEKTALKLLDSYATLDGVYENIESITGKLKEGLIANKEMAYLSYKLATIECNVPIKLDYKDFEKQKVDKAEVEKLLQELDLRQIRDKVLSYVNSVSISIGESGNSSKVLEDRVKISSKESSTTPVNYYLVENITELDNLLKDIKTKKLVCIDYETTGLDFLKDKIIGISFSLKSKEAFYLDLSGRTKIGVDDNTLLEKVFDVLKHEDIKVIGHNLKYEYRMTKAINKNFGNLYFDTMIAAYLINSESNKYSMDDLALSYLSYNTIKYNDITDNAKKTLLDVELKDVVNYACEDADITFRLYEIFKPLLEERELNKVFYELEMPLIRVIGDIENKGVHINVEHLKKLSNEYLKILKNTEEKIYKEAGREFNIQSPKQLGDILFTEMKIPPLKKNKTGFSTDEEVLQELSKKYKIADYLLQYRKYAKLKNTYIDTLPTQVREETNRIHASFNQIGTSTGRFSSSNPNLQNIPIRGEEGKDIRKSFVAEKGNVLIGADYSQIELRLLAHFSGDEVLIEAFKHNQDIHKKTAMKIFSLAENHITSSMRNTAKIINFSIIYGKTAFGLSKELNISRREAEDFIKGYFDTYKKVEPFTKSIVEDTKKYGYVRTIMGRMRDLSERIHSTNSFAFAEGVRMAVNTVIQGSAADLIKVAMLNVYKEFQNNFKTASIIMQVHDELVVEVSEAEVDKALKVIKEIMENAITFKVPIVVEIKKGDNWDSIH